MRLSSVSDFPQWSFVIAQALSEDLGCESLVVNVDSWQASYTYRTLDEHIKTPIDEQSMIRAQDLDVARMRSAASTPTTSSVIQNWNTNAKVVDAHGPLSSQDSLTLPRAPAFKTCRVLRQLHGQPPTPVKAWLVAQTRPRLSDQSRDFAALILTIPLVNVTMWVGWAPRRRIVHHVKEWSLPQSGGAGPTIIRSELADNVNFGCATGECLTNGFFAA